MGRITAAADYAALSRRDLVIEAVFEDRKVKAEAIAKAQAVLSDKAIFISNTSTLPITSLAGEFQDPRASSASISSRRWNETMLVEVIMGKNTGEQALATALDYVRLIRKTLIVVNDLVASMPIVACSTMCARAT